MESKRAETFKKQLEHNQQSTGGRRKKTGCTDGNDCCMKSKYNKSIICLTHKR